MKPGGGGEIFPLFLTNFLELEQVKCATRQNDLFLISQYFYLKKCFKISIFSAGYRLYLGSAFKLVKVMLKHF